MVKRFTFKTRVFLFDRGDLFFFPWPGRGLDFGLMSILYMYVYIDCGLLWRYAKNVYDSNFKQTCLPHRFNHTSPFSVGVKPHFINIPPKLWARNSKSRFKGIYKAIGFHPLMRFNNLKYKVSVLWSCFYLWISFKLCA